MPATHLSVDDSNSEFKKPINRMHACVLSHFSHVRFCAMLWTASCQAPLSMKFSRQEYGNGLPCTPPGDLPNSGIKLMSSMSTCIGRWILYH